MREGDLQPSLFGVQAWPLAQFFCLLFIVKKTTLFCNDRAHYSNFTLKKIITAVDGVLDVGSLPSNRW